MLNNTNISGGTFVANFAGTTNGFGTTINGTISGQSNVNFTNSNNSSGGSGILQLNNFETYTGSTGINLGAGSTVAPITPPGTVQLGIVNGNQVNNVLPTSTAIVFGSTGGSGILDLNGDNQQVTSIASTGTAAATAAMFITDTGSSNSTLTLLGSVSPATPFAGTITQSGSAVNLVLGAATGPNNTATDTLTGANNYTGGTSIYGGTLVISNTPTSATYGSSGTGTGPVQVNSGGTLAGSAGNISGTVTIASGGNLSPGSPAANGASLSTGTLTVGGLTLNSGANLNFKLDSLDSSDKIVVSGSNTLTVNGGTFNFTNFGHLGPGLYDLISYSGSQLSTAAFDNFSNYLTPTPMGIFTLQLKNDPGEIDLQVSATTATWNPAGNPNGAGTAWDTNSQNTTSLNWNVNSQMGQAYADGYSVIFGNSGVGTVNIIPAAGVNPSAVTINNTSGTYTFTGNAITGVTGVTINGVGGTTIFENANTYTGGTYVTNGTLSIGLGGSLPSDQAVTMSAGGTLNLNDNSTIVSTLSGSAGSVNLGSLSTTTLTLEPTASSSFGVQISAPAA